MKNLKLAFLVPVFSAFLFISRVPPTMSSQNLHSPTIQTADYISLERLTSPLSAPKATTLKNDISHTNNQESPAKTSIPRKPTPVNQVKQTTSRSTAPKSVPAASKLSKLSAIIATSKRFIGVRYLFGGTTPTGFDCSGFVQYVFAKNGISLPRVSRDQYNVGFPVSFSNLKPGNLVFFSLANNGIVDHEGIYLGNGQFINASSSKGVTIYTLGPYWQSAFIGAKQVL